MTVIPGDDIEDSITLEDPVVAAHIERAVAPYRALLSGEALAALEETLWMTLTTHPDVRPMIDRLRRDAATQRSGTRSAGRTERRKRGAR